MPSKCNCNYRHTGTTLSTRYTPTHKISTQDRTARDEQTTPEDTTRATAHPDPKTTTAKMHGGVRRVPEPWRGAGTLRGTVPYGTWWEH